MRSSTINITRDHNTPLALFILKIKSNNNNSNTQQARTYNNTLFLLNESKSNPTSGKNGSSPINPLFSILDVNYINSIINLRALATEEENKLLRGKHSQTDRKQFLQRNASQHLLPKISKPSCFWKLLCCCTFFNKSNADIALDASNSNKSYNKIMVKTQADKQDQINTYDEIINLHEEIAEAINSFRYEVSSRIVFYCLKLLAFEDKTSGKNRETRLHFEALRIKGSQLTGKDILSRFQELSETEKEILLDSTESGTIFQQLFESGRSTYNSTNLIINPEKSSNI